MNKLLPFLFRVWVPLTAVALGGMVAWANAEPEPVTHPVYQHTYRPHYRATMPNPCDEIHYGMPGPHCCLFDM